MWKQTTSCCWSDLMALVANASNCRSTGNSLLVRASIWWGCVVLPHETTVVCSHPRVSPCSHFPSHTEQRCCLKSKGHGESKMSLHPWQWQHFLKVPCILKGICWVLDFTSFFFWRSSVVFDPESIGVNIRCCPPKKVFLRGLSCKYLLWLTLFSC